MPPATPADLNATTDTSTPPAATTFHPIPTGQPALTSAQQSSAKAGLSGIGAAFKNVGQPGETASAFNAIYGTGQLSAAPSMGGNQPTPALQPMAPLPALGSVAAANTTINPPNAAMSQSQVSTISDRQAKTNIRDAKKDVYSFLEFLNRGNK